MPHTTALDLFTSHTEIRVKINGAWITAEDRKTHTIFFLRAAEGPEISGTWYDTDHAAIMNHLYAITDILTKHLPEDGQKEPK